MQIAVSMWSVQKSYSKGEMNIIEFLKWVPNTNADGVELLDFFWKDPAAELPLVLDTLEALNLPVGAYAVGNDFGNPDATVRKEQLAVVTRGVDMAKKLNTKVVRVFSGNLAEGITLEMAQTWIVEGLRRAAEYAEKHGIVLALENHGLLAGKSSQVEGIISEVGSDYLRSTTDIGNFMLVDEDPVAATAALAPLAAHVHVKDFRLFQDGDSHFLTSLAGKKYVGTVVGEGSIDFTSALRALKKAEYKGWLSVEFEGDGYDRAGTIASVENLRQALINA